jgi:hypothetical protein
MSVPQQECPDSERLERNVQRTAAMHALKKIAGIVDQDLREEAARIELLRVLLRYGWMVLLPLAWLLAHYFGVI